MSAMQRAKQERIVEAVRRNLEGDAAVEFLHQSGYAMNSQGIARHLRQMGGRGRVQALLDEGSSNVAVLEACFPAEDFTTLKHDLASQGELFGGDSGGPPLPHHGAPHEEFETTRLSLRLPTDLYEAIRLAARAEGKSHVDLIIEILTSALSRMPAPPPGE